MLKIGAYALVLGFLAMAAALPCQAATVMVNVRADFSSAVISPQSMARAKQMVSDIESNLLEQFFNQGHIAVNLPASIRTTKTKEKPRGVDELLWDTKKSGAEILVYCTVTLKELDPNEPVQVTSCDVTAFDTAGGSGFPFKLLLPITDATRDTDLKPDIIRSAQMITSRLQS